MTDRQTINRFAKAGGIPPEDVEFLSAYVYTNQQVEKAFKDFCIKAKLILVEEYAQHRKDQAALANSAKQKENQWFTEFTNAEKRLKSEQNLVKELYALLMKTPTKFSALPLKYTTMASLCITQGLIKERWLSQSLRVVDTNKMPSTLLSNKVEALYNTYYREYQ